MKNNTLAKEGDLYKVYTVEEHTFEIRYGYYEQSERGLIDPLPVFPDLVKRPAYTKNGRPVVTVIQVPCKYYAPHNKQHSEEWCGDCMHYSDASREIAVCNCDNLKEESI